MHYYRHQFDRVEDYLHHRPPYLLVQEIVSIEDRRIVTRSKILGNEFYLQGHFPGAPILPGAMMQEFSTQSAGILIAARYNPMAEFNTHDPFFNEYALGVLVKVTQARFRGFARPGDSLVMDVRLNDQAGEMFDFTARLSANGQPIMRNNFRLTNILSSTLQGHPAQQATDSD